MGGKIWTMWGWCYAKVHSCLILGLDTRIVVGLGLIVPRRAVWAPRCGVI